MPHIDEDGKVYARVTEIISGIECDEKSYHHKQAMEDLRAGKMKGHNNVTTFAALAGTIVHNDIENFLRKQEGLPPVPLELDENAEKMLFEIEKIPDLKEEMNRKIGNAFNNFLMFWEEFEPEILEIEATLLGEVEGVPIKGSADLICAIDVEKLDKAGKVKPRPEKKGKKEIVILDWKSGSSVRSTHRTQISAYYTLAQKDVLPRFLDDYDYYKVGGKPRGVDVYLGGSKFKFKIFDLEPALFFYNVEIYKEAERVPLNHLMGKIGVTLQYCLYCPYRSKCSAIQEGVVMLVPMVGGEPDE